MNVAHARLKTKYTRDDKFHDYGTLDYLTGSSRTSVFRILLVKIPVKSRKPVNASSFRRKIFKKIIESD